MSDDSVITFLEQLREARIEAGQCIYCGSEEDTEDNPMEVTIEPDGVELKAHRYCEVMKNYPTQDDTPEDDASLKSKTG